MPLVVPDANAAVSIKIKTATYPISGKNGIDLLDAMDRRGPKHGFLTRAIAQTSYTVYLGGRLEGETTATAALPMPLRRFRSPTPIRR